MKILNEGKGTDGTTNEAVLEMLINRLQLLQNQLPCRENAIALTKLEEALMWLEKRAEDTQKHYKSKS